MNIIIKHEVERKISQMGILQIKLLLYKSLHKKSYNTDDIDDDPRGVANLDPRGMIGRIYVEYHLTLLHTKYTSFRPCGFREVNF